MTSTEILAIRPRFYRSSVSRGARPRIERTGGDSKAGLIRGAALVTAGEVLGHRQWLDQEFVETVYKQLRAAGRKGVKMRFTHPGLSADGLGTYLGRAKAGVLRDGRVVADIHLSQAAHQTPDGDLASYVMDLAAEDPEAFGVSIVFEPDYGAAEKFKSEHKDEDGDFKSPDPNNVKNYPHARLARLRAADVVDEPAANPGGLFRRGQGIAEEADRLCAYALGLSDERPSLSHLSAIDADRLAGFAARFLKSHNLTLKEESAMPAGNQSGSESNVLMKDDLEKALAATSDAILLKVDEKLAAYQIKPADDPESTPEEIEKRGALRASQIYAYATNAGLNDHAKVAQEAIDKGLSVEAFKATIADRLIAQNGLTRDGGDEKGDDPHAKFRAEYRDGYAQFTASGVSEDSYIRTRCRDEGLPVPAIKAS